MQKPKKCITCNAELTGREDKKFCDNYCRTSFHNRIQRFQNASTTKIVRILRKNRLILEYFYKSGKVSITENQLIDAGFNTDYFTQYFLGANGNKINYCFEYSYYKKSSDLVVIRIKNKKNLS